jgi:voltage-gated potassium channel Kch
MPVMLLGTVGAIIVLKLLVLLPLARLFRMPLADATRFSFSLAQGGEFAFVLVSFAAGLQLIGGDKAALLVAAVAISMAFAPLLMMFDDRVLQRRFAASGTSRPADRIESNAADVVIAGHGRFGMTIGRLLQANGVRYVVLDHDAEQIDAMRRFGFKVFYGDASRLDLLDAAGAREAKVLVIAIDDREKTLEMVDTAHKHFPHLKVMARAFDRVHAYELLNAGVPDVYREVFGSSVDVGRDVLTALGRHPFEARRAAALFKAHDERMTRESAAHRDDTNALIDLSRQSRTEIANVLAADRGEVATDADPAWSTPEREEA